MLYVDYKNFAPPPPNKKKNWELNQTLTVQELKFENTPNFCDI